jgi:hypothetical protein
MSGTDFSFCPNSVRHFVRLFSSHYQWVTAQPGDPPLTSVRILSGILSVEYSSILSNYVRESHSGLPLPSVLKPKHVGASPNAFDDGALGDCGL